VPGGVSGGFPRFGSITPRIDPEVLRIGDITAADRTEIPAGASLQASSGYTVG